MESNLNNSKSARFQALVVNTLPERSGLSASIATASVADQTPVIAISSVAPVSEQIVNVGQPEIIYTTVYDDIHSKYISPTPEEWRPFLERANFNWVETEKAYYHRTGDWPDDEEDHEYTGLTLDYYASTQASIKEAKSPVVDAINAYIQPDMGQEFKTKLKIQKVQNKVNAIIRQMSELQQEIDELKDITGFSAYDSAVLEGLSNL
jgi:hypothetical protein